jgi:hypothetical protein
MIDIAEGITQTDIDRIVTLQAAALFARRDGRPEDAAVIEGEISAPDHTAMDHLAAGVILMGRSMGALAKNDITINDIEKAAELDYEAAFEMDSIEGGEV